MTQQSFLNQVKEGAIQGWHKYKVLPSITAAQACLESGWGQSALAKSPNYNLFGIKSSADWNGPSVNYRTQEWSASKGYYYVYADFRVYSSWNESIEQHGAFFTNTDWRKNNYRKVVGERNYKTAAQELKNAGYATDPGYPPKLINIIEQYNLQEWDREAFAGGNGGSSAGTSTSTRTAEPRIVGGSITTQATNDTSKRSITVIGDSLGVGTEPYLKNYTWKSANYNNYGSRQWTHSQSVYDGLVQLQSFINAGTLNDYVVMILGTNRGVNSSEIQRAVNMIGSNRKLLLVDTDSQVGHKDSVASAYMLASETYANVFYVNWSHTASSSYYGSDNIHMTSAGYKAHAEFIVQAVYEVANTNWTNEPTKIVTESNKIVTNIKNVNYQDDIFVSPNGESIIYNKTLNDQFGFRPKSGQVLWIERILKVNSDNEKEMLEEGLAYMREHSQPATQYTVSLKELPDTVSIGDVGIFVDHEFNPPLAIEARVLNITTSQSNPNNNTVTIGNVKELYPQSKDDIIAIQKQLQETREGLLDEFYEGEPLNIVIEGTSGLILSGERSQFRTELIIGPTTNLGLTGEGSHTIELYGAQKTDNEFRFSGKLTNTLIFEEVDEAFKYIVENTESDAVIDDPSQNPQGIDIPNPLQPVDMKTLDIQDFEVEFLDALGQVVLTDTIPIYDDGQFNYPIVGFDKNIRQIRILHDKDMDFATISFTEREANRATIDSTQLVARVYQGNREVTERFDNFSWVRVSEDSREDEGWNDKNKFVQSNHITVYADDIEDNESTFIVRLFDNDFERIVVSSSAVVKVNVEGKSAYELAVEAGFEGTLDEWVSSLRGSDGINGIPGEPGKDGQSTFIHVAWADSPMGDGFSTSDSTDKEYMGTYVDDIEADSENYLDYKWMRVKGKDGVSITEIKEHYLATHLDKGVTRSTDGWTDTIQNITAINPYLWNYEQVFFSDNTDHVTQPVIIGHYGVDGTNGTNGVPGKDGKDGVTTYTWIKYADDINGNGINNSPVGKKFIGFAYNKTTPVESDTPTEYKWSKILGEDGKDGTDGVHGEDGKDGQTTYTWIKYSPNANGSDMTNLPQDNTKYIGIAVNKTSPTESTTPGNYTWSKFIGEDGKDGTDGVPGKNGVDGKTTYTWIRYADDINGGGIDDSPVGKKYIGFAYNKTTATESNVASEYKWSKILGEDGVDGTDGVPGKNGVDGQTTYTWVKYSPSSDGSNMTNSPQTNTKYIGIAVNKTTPTESTTKTDYTWSKFIGEDGSNGRGIESITEYYLVNNLSSGVTRSTSGWSTTIKATSPTNRYLWNYEVIKYTDTTEFKTLPVIIGTHGETGDSGKDGNPGKDGVGIKSTTITYGVSANETTQPATYTSTVPALVKGQYLWTKTIWVYTDSTTETGYTKTYIPKDGNDGTNGLAGKDGVGIKSTVINYATSSSGTTRPTSGWTSTVPSVTPGNYLWTKTTWTYTDNDIEEGYSVSRIGKDGAKGDTGDKGADGTGIKSAVIAYTIHSNGTTTPTSGWVSTVPSPVKGSYMWTRTITTYTDNTTSTTYSVAYQATDGQQGPKGADGSNGTGISSTAVTYAQTTSGTTTPTSWSGTRPAPIKGQYLWSRTIITYTNGTSSTAYSTSYSATDGQKGDKGDKGDTGATGPRGATGSQGPRGATGTSVDSITEYYLATSASSGILSTNSGFTTTIQPLTATNKYLWNYEKINFSDGTDQPTIPVIIGVYGDKGQTGSTGATGRSIVSITEHYLATSASSGVTRSTSGWSTTMQPTTETNRYLWNYETIKWSSGTTTTYVEPIIIGVHGAKGPQGPQGPQGIKGDNGSNGQSQWVHVRYSANSNGSGMTTSPSSTTKYVGIAVTNSATAPAYTGFTWSKYVGENGSNGAQGPQGPQGVPGTNGTNGQTTYTWVKYADTPTSGMNDFPAGKKYIGLAFNKTTQTESTSYSAYQWSLMPQNIEIGGRNLLRNSGEEVSNGSYNIASYDLTDTIKENEEVTLTIWGSLAATKSYFSAYNSGGSVSVATLTDNGNGTYSRTFNWKIGTSNNTYLNVYAFTNAQTGTSTINKIKLERGNVATDWTEAPEDTQSKIDEKANNSDLSTTIQTVTEESEKIASLRTDVDITKNNFLITHTDEYVNKITTTESSVDGLDKRVVSVEETKENIDTFFQFDDAFTIGKSNAQTKLRLTNDEIQFLDGETKGTYITGNTMVSQNIQIQDGFNLPKHTMETEGDITVIRFTG